MGKFIGKFTADWSGNHLAYQGEQEYQKRKQGCCNGSWESVDWCDGEDERCYIDDKCLELKDGKCPLRSVKDVCLICGRVLE